MTIVLFFIFQLFLYVHNLHLINFVSIKFTLYLHKNKSIHCIYKNQNVAVHEKPATSEYCVAPSPHAECNDIIVLPSSGTNEACVLPATDNPQPAGINVEYIVVSSPKAQYKGVIMPPSVEEAGANNGLVIYSGLDHLKVSRVVSEA